MNASDRHASVGERLPSLLHQYGIDHVFGIPGVHNLEMYRGLSNSGVRHILSRHEQGAGFMADGFARASGRPAACFVITGPGLTNLMTPLGQAYSDSIPLLAIASSLARSDSGQSLGRLHEMNDQCGAAATVTGSSVTAATPSDVLTALSRAFRSFATERPRPVYIEIPRDVLSDRAVGDWSAPKLQQRKWVEPAGIAEAVAILSQAKRPVMVVGGGAVGAVDGVRVLAERLAAIVIPTIAGKGVLPDSHPLCSVAGLSLPAVRDRLAGADVVLAVGTELAETDHWCNQLVTSVALVRIDIDRNTLASGHGDQIGLLGDASAMIEAVLNKVGRAPANLAERTEEVATLRARVAPDLQARSSMYAPVLDAIRAALSTDTVVVTDMTELAYAGNDLFWVERPRSWLHPVGFGTLGYALPAAIGAKLGAPTRPVVAMAGDYGFQYTLPELAVAVEHALTLPVLIWNNEGLGVISRKMKQSGIEAVGVAPRNPDFQLLAQAYNCPGHVPASLAAVPKAIAAAFAHPGPSLIELRQSALVGDVG